MTLPLLQSLPSSTKSIQATQVLADLARQLGSGAKLPTTRDLCKQMRISRSTLDSALEDLEIRGLLQRKRGSGVYVSPLARTRRIGVVFGQGLFSNQAESFSQLLFKSLRPEATRHNCLITYYLNESDHNDDDHGPRQLALDAENGRVDALLLTGVAPKQILEVQSLGIPCVFLTGDKLRKPRIDVDTQELIREGVRQLIQRGCRRIAYAYPDFESHPHAAHYPAYIRVFRQALAQAELADEDGLLIPYDFDNKRTRQLEASGRFHELWHTWAVKPQGLFSTDDHYTAGILHAAKLLGVRVPQDLIVVSHANKGLDLFGDAQVVRLEFDPIEIAQSLLNTVDELLEPGAMVTEERLVRPQVILPAAREKNGFVAE